MKALEVGTFNQDLHLLCDYNTLRNLREGSLVALVNTVIIAFQADIHLIAADHNPDASQPVRDEDEADHEEAQNDGAVLVKSAQ